MKIYFEDGQLDDKRRPPHTALIDATAGISTNLDQI